MSLRVKIPKEITTYQEKIVFGLSARQLICSGLALFLSVGLGYTLSVILKLNNESVGWVIIIAVLPLMMIGWLKPNGFYIEEYIKIRLRYSKKTGIRVCSKRGVINGDVLQEKKGSKDKTKRKKK